MNFLKLNMFIKAIGTAGCLLLGGVTLPAQEGTLLSKADYSSLPASKLKLTKDWSAQDGLRLQSRDWWWGTATLAVGTNAAFDFSHRSEDGWYRLQLSPLFLGLEIEGQLK